MANSIRQQLLCGDSNHIHPMKDNLGLNLMQIDTEFLNCQEDDDEAETDHQHHQNDIHSDTDGSNTSDSDGDATASDDDINSILTSKVDENSLGHVPFTATNMELEPDG
jgi:hypothetical protein